MGRINEFYQAKRDAVGAEPIAELRDRLPDHRLFRRNIVFAHKNFEWVLDALDADEPVGLVTGLVPSGPFHLGHKGLIEQVVLYQQMGIDVTISLADVDAYLNRGRSLAQARESAIEEYLLNYVALGLDLDSADVYLQSEGGQEYHTMATLLARHVDSEAFERYGIGGPDEVTASLLRYADLFRPQLPDYGGPKPTFSPLGIDQDLDSCQELAASYDLQDLRPPAVTYHRFVRGFDGQKMSSSSPSTTIGLTDNPVEAKDQILSLTNSYRTDPLIGHERGEDVMLDLLTTHLIEDDRRLAQIKREYESDDLMFDELKQLTATRIETLLKEHQRRRAEVRPTVEQFVEQQLGVELRD